ncbi:50S ribosomal protein L13 [Patescibacteria group bacterium]|nr:50S ribosomal protein L13 [Patescibacteria group bacterium]
MKKTTQRPKPAELLEIWHVIDAEGKILGRLATAVARILIGKHKATYDPAVLGREKVIVTNADKVKLTGNKLTQKVYRHHTGYPGGLKTIPIERMLVSKPGEVIRHAVSGMIPHNKLHKLRLNNLKIYTGAEHPHVAQNPVKLEI